MGLKRMPASAVGAVHFSIPQEYRCSPQGHRLASSKEDNLILPWASVRIRKRCFPSPGRRHQNRADGLTSGLHVGFRLHDPVLNASNSGQLKLSKLTRKGLETCSKLETNAAAPG